MSKGGPIDPVTGKKVYEETGRMVPDRKGGMRPRLRRSKRLAETDDAFALVASGTRMETIYATHSNS